MGMFAWFDTREAAAFGAALAELLVRELPVASEIKEKKFAPKVEKALAKLQREVAIFKQKHALNMFKKASLSNSFLWTLKDKGVSDAYSQDLTNWLTERL